MKKTLFIVIAWLLVCVLSFSACGDSTQSSVEDGNDSNAETPSDNGGDAGESVNRTPVYKGMTVTYTADSRKEESKSGATNAATAVAVSDEKIYYATANQDIYINVHITNPDQFEIQSITLNGKKYTEYMFESGSTTETLILKVNVGSGNGIAEYTVDRIKYIDGTEIKDVKIEGEKTVRVEIGNEKRVTEATLSSLPHKVQYFVGERADYTGLVVTATFNDGTIVKEGPEACTFSGFNSDSPVTNQKITVTYGEYSFTFTIEIKRPPELNPTLARIELYTMPKTVYRVGEWLDVSGGVLLLIYTDGSTYQIQLTHSYISGFDSSRPGTYNVTVRYSENGIVATCSYTIMVTE